MAQQGRPGGKPDQRSNTRANGQTGQRPGGTAHGQPNRQPNGQPTRPADRQPNAQPEKQLAVPAAAAQDPASFELLRVWVADQAQQISLRAGVWQEPAAWGIMLADLARNIVQVHVDHDEGLDGEAFLAALLEGFDNEIESVLDEYGDEESEAD